MSPSIDDVDLTQRELPKDLKQLRTEVDHPEEGFFGPDSLNWKFGRENILGLGGMSAILLQLSHPKVAAGVADHSDFYHDPIGRLERTFQVIHRVVFGTVEEALEAALRVRIVHEAVQGELPESVGQFEVGDEYHANQPDLLLWVHATLVEQTINGYERYVDPLSESTKEDYYQESKTSARLFGIPSDTLPETYADFRQYYDRILRETIATGKQARTLKEQLLSHHGYLAGTSRFLASAMMSEPAREAFGLPWNPVYDYLDRGLCTLMPKLVKRLPPELRFVKKYRHRMIELGHEEDMRSFLTPALKPLSSSSDVLRQFI